MKRMIRYCVSEDYYRPLYSFVAAAYILATFYFWVPIPLVVWDVRLPAIRSIIYGKLGEQTSDKSMFNLGTGGVLSLLACVEFVCQCLVHTSVSLKMLARSLNILCYV